MKHEARTLFNTTQALFTTHYQRRSYQTLIAGFLSATGNPRPATATDKSAAALSRFLNQYAWNARYLIRIVRTAIQKRVWDTYATRQGRKPTLEIMLDLTTLEKTGAFPDLEIHALKDKIGLHLIVLYIVIGNQRFLTLTMHLTGRVASLGHSSFGAAKVVRVPHSLACDSCSASPNLGRSASTCEFSPILGLTAPRSLMV